MPTGRHPLALVVALALVLGASACEPEPVTPTAPGTARVVVLGDSIPSYLFASGASGIDVGRFTAIDGSLWACDGADGNPPARSVTGAIVATSAACDHGWTSLYPKHLTIRADAAVVVVGPHAMLDHLLDGTWRHPCHAPARSWYQADIAARLRYLRTVADRVVLVLPAWPGALSGWIMPADRAKRADCVRGVMRAAATQAGAETLDLGARLCPGGPLTCNDWRDGDGVHIDREDAPAAMTWLLDGVGATP